MIENALFDDKGGIPVWGVKTASGNPFYSFKLTEEDEFVLFPNKSDNAKAPKFILKRSEKRDV